MNRINNAGLAVGAAINANLFNKSVEAYLDAGAVINVLNDLDVKAKSTEVLDSNTMGGGGGGAVLALN